MRKTIDNLIERHASKHPLDTSVTFQNTSLTYEQLIEASTNLATYLKSKNVGKNQLVAIHLNRSLELIITILAILMSGAAYLPLTRDQPINNINKILNETSTTLLITDAVVELANFSANVPQIMFIDKDFDNIKLLNFNMPELPSINKDIAYVIYTSGTTGKPKGIMVSHANLLNAYKGWEKIYNLKDFKVCILQMAKFSFDVFTGDLVRALCSGGKLVLCPQEILFEPKSLYKLMIHEKINCAEFVPAVLRLLIEYLIQTQQRLDFMKLIIVGSDTWNIGDFKKLSKLCHSSTRIINSYGITETTIDSTYFDTIELNKLKLSDNNLVPIGRPFPNTDVYLLNQNLHPVLPNEVGEIYIGGAGVTSGYINNTILTSTKFINNPFDKKNNKKLYKSGDLARYLPNGDLQFLGRVDNQIKIRGYRIELEAIESVLNSHPSINSSIVIVRKKEKVNHQLLALIVLRKDKSIDLSALLNFLTNHLPDYMIPQQYRLIDKQPLTANGKIDRNTKLRGKNISIVSRALPKTKTEQLLMSIFQNALKTKKIDIHLTFNMLGVDSISLAHIVGLINKKLSVSLSICDTMQHCCITKMANHIDKQRIINIGMDVVAQEY